MYLFLRDLVCQFLGGGENLDGCLVLQNVAFGGGEHLQDLVLDLLQLSVGQREREREREGGREGERGRGGEGGREGEREGGREGGREGERGRGREGGREGGERGIEG